MESGKVLFLNEREIKKLLTPRMVMELAEQALADYANDNTINPVKLHLPLYPDYDGYINSMPSYIKNKNLAGAKFVSVHKHNQSIYGLPATLGVIILNHPETGLPFAIMDGTYITAMRTGAVTGIIAKYLARQNSKVLTVIGAGEQGLRSFLMIAETIKTIEQVRVVDIRAEAQETFINKATKILPKIKYVKIDNIQTACTGSDIVVMAASTENAILQDTFLNKGTTVLELSGGINREFLSKFDKHIVDFTECYMVRHNEDGRYSAKLAGRSYDELSSDLVDGEIGDVIVGKLAGRLDENEIILGGAVGMSVVDLTVAYEAYNLAIKNGLGKKLELIDIDSLHN